MPLSASPSHRQVLVAYSGIMLATLLAALDQTIVATALPSIVGDLHGFSEISWVVTAYLVASTVTVPLYGSLSDLFGRRRLFVVAISLFLLGSALCGAAQSMGQLIAFRALQGLGAGGLLPLSQAAIADLFSPRERGRYQGYIGAVWATAAVAGPLLGGTLTDAASWRWIFLVNLPLGALALVVVMRTMRAPVQARRHRIDVLGALVLSAAITCLLLACSWGGTTYPWDSVEVVGAGAAGLALSATFIVVERRAREPLLPLSLFRVSIFSISSGATFIVGAILFGVTIAIPIFVQGALGASATNSGVVLIPLSFGWVAASMTSGQLMSRTGRYRPFPIVGSVLVLAGVVLLTRLDAGSSRATVAFDLVVIGLGMGTMFQTYVIATQNAVEVARLGIATAALQFFRSMGGSVAVAGLGALMTSRVGAELAARAGDAGRAVDPNLVLQGGGRVPPALREVTQQALAAALHSVFLATVPLAIAGLGLALALPERPLRRERASERARDAAPALSSGD